MFVCEACHKKRCKGTHVLVSYGACEFCRRRAECFDCVATFPVTKAELEGVERMHAKLVGMYRHTGTLEYPRPRL